MKGISSSFPEIHQKEGGRLQNGWNATQLLLSEKVSGRNWSHPQLTSLLLLHLLVMMVLSMYQIDTRKIGSRMKGGENISSKDRIEGQLIYHSFFRDMLCHFHFNQTNSWSVRESVDF